MEELAAAIVDQGLRCMELQALVVTDDEQATLAEADEFAGLIDVLQPDYVMSGFPGEPTDQAVANYRGCGGPPAPRVPGGSRVPARTCPSATSTPPGPSCDAPNFPMPAWSSTPGTSSMAPASGPISKRCRSARWRSCSSPITRPSNPTTWPTKCCSVGRCPVRAGWTWAGSSSAFDEKGYDGMVGVEIMSEELRQLSYEEFARQAHDAAAPYWR